MPFGGEQKVILGGAPTVAESQKEIIQSATLGIPQGI